MADWSTATPAEIIADIKKYKQRMEDEYRHSLTPEGRAELKEWLGRNMSEHRPGRRA